MEEQDRSVWNQAEIKEGIKLVQAALRMHTVGVYQLQAAIAAVHAEAHSVEETDWGEIAALYRELAKISPSPIIALNGAVAVAMAEGFAKGLALIDQLGTSKELDGYYLFHAARADLLRRLNRPGEAAQAYRRALSLATNRVEQGYLQRRLQQVSAAQA